MSRIKDLYVGIGHKYDRIINEHWYLRELASNAAIEVDNYILGRSQELEHVQELGEIFETYQLQDTDTVLTERQFPYMALWKAMMRKSEKDVRLYSEVALEMRLLRSEIKNIPQSNNLPELRSFLVDFSKECGAAERPFKHYLVG